MKKWLLEGHLFYIFLEKDIWGSSKIFLMTLLFRYGLKMIEKGEFHKKKIFLRLWNKVYMKKWLLEGYLFWIFFAKDKWGSSKIFLMTLLFRYGRKIIEKGFLKLQRMSKPNIKLVFKSKRAKKWLFEFYLYFCIKTISSKSLITYITKRNARVLQCMAGNDFIKGPSL